MNLASTATNFINKPALIFEGQVYTYSDLDEASNRVANGLSESGISRGDRVALFLPNIPSFVFVYLGIQKVGAVAVSINSGFKSDEVGFILKDSGARILVTTEALRTHVSADDTPDLIRVLIAEGQTDTGADVSLSELMDSASPEALTMDMQPDDPAVILYTSGTTGFPKGAVLSHDNVVSNVNTCISTFDIQPKDKILLFVPLFHNFGQNAALLPSLGAGATILLHREFELKTILESIQRYDVTTFYGVPTIYTLLYDEATAEQMQSVRRYISAAASLPSEVAAKWRDKFQVAINEGYGLTESSLACFNPCPDIKPGSVGIPLAEIEVQTINAEGRETVPGELGEIAISGPGVMSGYWNRPVETTEAIRDGKFYTGDIGKLDDDGYLYIVDRVKDRVNVGGMKLYPSEVENIIYQHPGVLEAAVYGVPENVLGEQVVASVVLKPDQAVTDEEIMDFCRQRIADFKVPGKIIFTDSLPKGRTGKVLKKILRDQFKPDICSCPEEIPGKSARLSSEEMKRWMVDWIAGKRAIAAETIQTDQAFAGYGLNSILTVQLIHDLESGLQNSIGSDQEISLSAALAFRYTTIDQLTAFILQSFDSKDSPLTREDSITDELITSEMFPLSSGQRALWFVQQLVPENTAYNTAVSLRIRSGLDVDLLKAAFQALITRHPCLRTSFFIDDDGEPVQKVDQHQRVDFQQFEAGSWTWDELNNRVVEDYKRPFALEHDSMLRVSLYTRAPDDQILLFTIHHIVIDGWSQWMLIEELGPVVLCNQGKQGSGIAIHKEPLCELYLLAEEDVARRARKTSPGLLAAAIGR